MIEEIIIKIKLIMLSFEDFKSSLAAEEKLLNSSLKNVVGGETVVTTYEISFDSDTGNACDSGLSSDNIGATHDPRGKNVR